MNRLMLIALCMMPLLYSSEKKSENIMIGFYTKRAEDLGVEMVELQKSPPKMSLKRLEEALMQKTENERNCSRTLEGEATRVTDPLICRFCTINHDPEKCNGKHPVRLKIIFKNDPYNVSAQFPPPAAIRIKILFQKESSLH